MKFPWDKYEELPLERRNTLQIFITNKCNLKCNGCFARNIMLDNKDISLEEYTPAVSSFLNKGGRQINILGGEPLMHPNLKELLKINRENNIKTTIYTNGALLDKYCKEDFNNVKLRVSIYSKKGNKGVFNIPKTNIPFDTNFMVSKCTTLDEMLECADFAEKNYDSKTFFIYSMRELDNPRKEFFDDTQNCMSVLNYKGIVHEFLEKYEGDMEIHISKRGVFESTTTLPDTKCRFANYFIGGEIIQCPYDVVNLKFQKDYEFNKRSCQQNNTCLMSKIILRRKK
jgi:organic radical activating enzyme